MEHTLDLDKVLSKSFDKNERNSQPGEGQNICRLCGKVVNKDTAKWVHLHNGGVEIVTEERAMELTNDPDVGERADCGFFPVGPDCAKRIPKQFLSVFD